MADLNAVEILLVEDNPNDVELTVHALKKENLANQMFVVRDGEQALDFLFARGSFVGREVRNTPKVILLDLKLPKVSGLEVLRQIRADERTRTVPVVMLTSSREEPDIQESYKLGANSYIVKPVDFQNFVKSVSDMGMYWLLLNQPPC
jgi:two-component system response regulator